MALLGVWIFHSYFSETAITQGKLSPLSAGDQTRAFWVKARAAYQLSHRWPFLYFVIRSWLCLQTRACSSAKPSRFLLLFLLNGDDNCLRVQYAIIAWVFKYKTPHLLALWNDIQYKVLKKLLTLAPLPPPRAEAAAAWRGGAGHADGSGTHALPSHKTGPKLKTILEGALCSVFLNLAVLS